MQPAPCPILPFVPMPKQAPALFRVASVMDPGYGRPRTLILAGPVPRGHLAPLNTATCDIIYVTRAPISADSLKDAGEISLDVAGPGDVICLNEGKLRAFRPVAEGATEAQSDDEANRHVL